MTTDSSNQEKIVVAMSGGVDSSVAALLCQQKKVSTVGISMQVWDYRQNGGSRSRATCCAPDDFCDARRVAHLLDIPYYVFDFEQSFRQKVINKFVATYEAGETPNPCVDCNSKVKFRELRQRADSFGCSHIATGHYARIQAGPDGLQLLRAVDVSKDQSYFLYMLTQEELAKTIFPIGEMHKTQVRELARSAGLVTANKPESQDICFVSGSVQDFLVSLGSKRKKGWIVNRSGEKIGEHDGIHAFTVGQRKGLNLGGASEPLYVLELDSANNRVVVGPKTQLERADFEVREVNWLSPDSRRALSGGNTLECIAQVRYRHPGVKVRVTCRDEDRAVVNFMEQWATISPGQACVFYDLQNLRVLGGGTIANSRG